MSGTAPATAPAGGAGDAANESSTQKVFGVIKVSTSSILNLQNTEEELQQMFMVWAVTQIGAYLVVLILYNI
jgi:hypothetical protein